MSTLDFYRETYCGDCSEPCHRNTLFSVDFVIIIEKNIYSVKSITVFKMRSVIVSFFHHLGAKFKRVGVFEEWRKKDNETSGSIMWKTWGQNPV